MARADARKPRVKGQRQRLGNGGTAAPTVAQASARAPPGCFAAAEADLRIKRWR